MAQYDYNNDNIYIPIIENNSCRKEFNCPCCNETLIIEHGVVDKDCAITKPYFHSGKINKSNIGYFRLCPKCVKRRRFGNKLQFFFMGIFVILLLLACLSMLATFIFSNKLPEWFTTTLGCLILFLGVPSGFMLALSIVIGHIIFKTGRIDFDKALDRNAIEWTNPPQRTN